MKSVYRARFDWEKRGGCGWLTPSLSVCSNSGEALEGGLNEIANAISKSGAKNSFGPKYGVWAIELMTVEWKELL